MWFYARNSQIYTCEVTMTIQRHGSTLLILKFVIFVKVCLSLGYYERCDDYRQFIRKKGWFGRAWTPKESRCLNDQINLTWLRYSISFNLN